MGPRVLALASRPILRQAKLSSKEPSNHNLKAKKMGSTSINIQVLPFPNIFLNIFLQTGTCYCMIVIEKHSSKDDAFKF